MKLGKFVNEDTVQVAVLEVMCAKGCEKGSSMDRLYKDFEYAKKANVKITIDTQENIEFFNRPEFKSERFLFTYKFAEVTNTIEKGKAVTEFNYTDVGGGNYHGGKSLLTWFLFEAINIKPNCSDPKNNIHFTVDIDTLDYRDNYYPTHKDPYSMNEHIEFDFNPCTGEII